MTVMPEPGSGVMTGSIVDVDVDQSVAGAYPEPGGATT